MNLGSKALAKYLFSILAMLFCVSELYAQQGGSFGTSTKPHTVVYRLKDPSAHGGSARVAAPKNTLEQAVQKLNPKQHKQKFPHLSAPANARTSGTSPLSRIYELEYSADVSFEQVKRELLATGQVAYVEPLYQREPFHQPNDPRADSTKNDTYDQYYLKLIQAYSGWAVERGDASVVIGVLDTGFLLTHEDIQGKVARNESDPVDGIDNDGDGYKDNYYGWDFADRDNDVTDNTVYRGHGMGVAGVAAANTNNGIAMAGVGYNVKFMPLKVFTSTKTGGFGGYDAIVYAADKGCKVINLSWGGEYFSQYEQDIINYAVLEKDVVVIAAAGNTNNKIDMYPASYDNVISVGGTTRRDLKVPEHTYSYKVDVAAPSQDIYSTHATHNKGYTYTSGSSFGSPMVAACAALVRSRFPELNALQVMERVRVTTDNIYHLAGNEPYYGMLGKGRLNVKKALKETDVKSVRGFSFRTEQDRPLQSGQTTNTIVSLTNYLNPVQNLQVTLSSPSPYVSISDAVFSAGGIATSGTAHNTQQPFKITVSADAPANMLIPFRLDFSDGSYTDFQYFELIINPEFVTLNTDHVKLTFNGKGNIGYNGLKFEQGKGFTYKSDASLLFEGGLIVASAPDRVSDNLHNGVWMSDENFTSVVPAKVSYNTSLADQDLKGVMKDKYPATGNTGIEVKYKAYSWNTSGDQDFIVVEYQLKNITSETIAMLHAGLFADWDIGTYYENAADWDNTRRLGYAYNKVIPLPYTGIKLLTDATPSYYALDETNTDVNDGFTDAEKFKILSEGVKHTQAGKAERGSNIAHVVGATLTELAPGEARTIAFAVLAGDDLDALQKSADAAQQKYISIKSGPVPVAFKDTVCAGSSVTWAPEGGQNFRFYADAEKTKPLGSGRSYAIASIDKELVLYATNIDSLYESAVGSAVFSLPPASEVDFTFETSPIYPGTPVSFVNQSKNSSNYTWRVAGNAVAQASKDLTFAFSTPGTYEVVLTASDLKGCTTSSVTKQVTVQLASSEVLKESLQLYPNPTSQSIQIQLLPDAFIGKIPAIQLVDVTGRKIIPKVRPIDSMHAEINLEGLPAGVYYVQVLYAHDTFVRRIVVL